MFSKVRLVVVAFVVSMLFACSSSTGGTGGVDYEWSNWAPPADAPASTAYTTSTDTVTDTATGLVWQRNQPAMAMDWSSAKTYCAGLTLGGLNGWRLPALVELESIVNYGKFNPAIDTAVFPAPSSSYFWSSSPTAYHPSYAWVVNFFYGNASDNNTTSTGQVRCVR